MKPVMYLDLHVIQSVPPSCVNRDDTGSPKTAQYGGVTRSRVSSQSWKRAIRETFTDILPSEDVGYRTKYVVDLIAKELKDLGFEGNAEKVAEKTLEQAGLKIKDQMTGALFFISSSQAKAAAKLAFENEEIQKGKAKKAEKDALKDALSDEPSIDIALFGRMVADDPTMNIDASCQVAHAISTHAVTAEYDYFTAIDDLGPEDNAGAGHIGTVEFNSSTLYRYATVAVHDLLAKLGEDTASALQAFTEAFVTSMPTGKQNTFANRTLPSALLLTFRSDQPINLVGAFEKPIVNRGEGFVEPSIQRLSEFTEELYEDFLPAPEFSFTVGKGLEDLGERVSLSDLYEKVGSIVTGFYEKNLESQSTEEV